MRISDMDNAGRSRHGSGFYAEEQELASSDSYEESSSEDRQESIDPLDRCASTYSGVNYYVCGFLYPFANGKNLGKFNDLF